MYSYFHHFGASIARSIASEEHTDLIPDLKVCFTGKMFRTLLQISQDSLHRCKYVISKEGLFYELHFGVFSVFSRYFYWMYICWNTKFLLSPCYSERYFSH